MSCELHAYDLVDQYWEKLQDLPLLQSAMPFPLMVGVDRGEDSYLYVINNDKLAQNNSYVVHTGVLRLFRKNIG